MTDYPYVLANNKISTVISNIQTAAKPPKFTQDFLRVMGFTSTNDRSIVPLFKKLGFLTEDGTPTVYYDQLRDQTLYKRVLASRIKELYSELYAINVEIHKDTEANAKGIISRVTGADEDSVKRVYNTFKALCSIADFSQEAISTQHEVQANTQLEVPQTATQQAARIPSEFHYNFQIHLPATTDISVYNAIFKSLKDNLML